jgi:hypothetical protein
VFIRIFDGSHLLLLGIRHWPRIAGQNVHPAGGATGIAPTPVEDVNPGVLNA